MNAHVRPLTVDDHDSWLPLWHGYLEFYRHHLSDAQTERTFRRLLDDAVAMWGAVAVADGVVVGIVHWLTHPSTWSDKPYCYLEDLYVAVDARSSGVGAALIEHVTAWAAARDLPKVYWQTAQDNSTARRLYDRLATSEFVVYEVELD
ncbi:MULTISPECIES: GNAT family N-acetyltransferase [unclassified Gordonia (in: high G+C Gram-positive bacteria)]